MSLCNLREALEHAESGGYAIGSFNFYNLEMLTGIMEAASQENSPVILAIAEAHLPYIRWHPFMQMVIAEAEAAPVPVVIHLDHAQHFSTIYQSIRLGFTSVMYDGSMLSLAENTANTKQVVRVAHAMGVSVEAELGHIGGTTEEVGVAHSDRQHLTDPDLAPEFVRVTGVDALAVAFGTAHGFYIHEPQLDFALLAEIDHRLETSLVLHGGTGLSEAAFAKSIELGIRKINYGTDTIATATRAARQVLTDDPGLINYASVSQEVHRQVRSLVASKMRIFGSAGQCWVPTNTLNLA